MTLTLISTNAAGTAATDVSGVTPLQAPILSPDGTLALFETATKNFVAGSTNAYENLYLKNISTGALTEVDTSSTGVEGNAGVVYAADYSNGIVLFDSTSTSLDPRATTSQNRIFQKNVTTGVLTLISPSDYVVTTVQGAVETSSSFFNFTNGALSSDGRYVAALAASNDALVLFDTLTHTAVDLTGSSTYSVTAGAFAKAAGKLVFATVTPLSAGDTDTYSDIYVYDLASKSITLASTSGSGVKSNADSAFASISADGNTIAFLSNATNLTSAATNPGTPGLYVKSLTTGQVTLADTNAAGIVANGNINSYTLSPDGQYVSFSSNATNLDPSVTTSTQFHTYVKSLATGALTRLDLEPSATPLSGGAAALSADDSKAVFVASGSNASQGVIGGLYLSAAAATTPSGSASTVSLVSYTQAGVEGNAASSDANIIGGVTASGTSVLFASIATNLNPFDTRSAYDLYLKNTSTGALTLVSVNSAGVQPNADTFYGSVDGDGNLVALTTTATNIDPRATDGNSHLYVRNVSAGTLTLIAPADYTIRNATSGQTEAASNFTNLVAPSISGAGRYVAAQANSGGATAEILVFDTANHTAVDLNGLSTVGSHAAVSQDGSTVVFHTTATLGLTQLQGADEGTQSFAAPSGLAAAAATPVREVYAYSVATNSFQFVSGPAGASALSNAANGDSVNPTVSNNGMRVAFQSAANNLDARDTDTAFDIYVKDLTTGQLFLADTTADGLTKANAAATNAYISGDGTMVTFTSAATNLVAGVTDGRTHVYLKSLATGAISLLDQTSTGAVGDGSATGAAIFAPDSAHVAFTSGSDNLVANDTNGVNDVFLANLAVATPPTNTAPTIGGAQAGQADTAGVAIQPFSTVTVADPDANQSETVTVSFNGANGALAGGGFVQTAPGVYSVIEAAGAAGASAAAAQAALRAAVFTPVAGQSATTTFTVTVSDGQAVATNSATSVVATYTPPATGGGGALTTTTASAQAGLTTEFQNLTRSLAQGADAQTPTSPFYAVFQAEKTVAAQLDNGQITLAQAETVLAHAVDGTTAVAIADYAFFTGYTPTAAGLNYLVHSPANATDLNDPYYAKFSTENRYINFAVNLATGAGTGAAAFAAAYGSLSLADATAKAYLAVFGTAADAAKVAALLNTLVPDGLGGQETRATYFAQYGGDGPNGQGTKAAVIGWLLANAVETGSGVYGAATEHYLAALAHGIAPAMGSELALTYGPAVNLVGSAVSPDPTVTG